MVDLIKWPSIESFYHIRRAVTKYPHILAGNSTVIYRGKIKLDGTNAAIQLLGDDVVAQSRKTILSETHDNAGFAAWVNLNKDKIIKAKGTLKNITIFGEWCGPGIGKGCAINLIDRKIFAIFAIVKTLSPSSKECDFISEPDKIIEILKNILIEIPDVYILPWYNKYVAIDWTKSNEELQSTIDYINSQIKIVEDCDPWVKKIFDKEGVGEGVVYYPRSSEHLSKDMFSTLAFKAKGEKHQTVKTKEPVVIDASTASSIQQFVDMCVTEARLEQGVREACDGEYEFNKIGKFIGWVSSDVNKECQTELESSGLGWKQVSKSVGTKARSWYMEMIKRS